MPQEQQALQVNQTIQRPSVYNNVDGFLNGMKWDSNHKAALFFFTTSRTTGSGENAKTTYIEFQVRFFQRDAFFLAFLLDHKKAEEDAGRKYPLLINMDNRMASWKRPTGEMTGDNNEIKKTQNVSFFEGKNSKLMAPKTYSILSLSSNHLTPEELAQQSNAA